MSLPSILIVEDESVVAVDLQSRLEGLGYKVTGMAPTGE
jgi:CheY-like chemotaxis protein